MQTPKTNPELKAPGVARTPQRVLRNFQATRGRVLEAAQTDGIFLGGIKWIFQFRLWDLPHQCCVRAMLKHRDSLNREFPDVISAECETRWCMEWYTVGCSLLLAICYAIAMWYPTSPRSIWQLCLFIAGISIAAFRTMELLAVMASLHLRGRYKSTAPMRALLLTFISYLHVIVAFAIFYVAVGHYSVDTFSDSCTATLTTDWITPLYFSLVTVTTLGFGDLSPNHWSGKLAVIIQTIVGIVFIVVVFQRVLAAANSASSNDDNVGK